MLLYFFQRTFLWIVRSFGPSSGTYGSRQSIKFVLNRVNLSRNVWRWPSGQTRSQPWFESGARAPSSSEPFEYVERALMRLPLQFACMQPFVQPDDPTSTQLWLIVRPDEWMDSISWIIDSLRFSFFLSSPIGSVKTPTAQLGAWKLYEFFRVFEQRRPLSCVHGARTEFCTRMHTLYVRWLRKLII